MEISSVALHNSIKWLHQRSCEISRRWRHVDRDAERRPTIICFLRQTRYVSRVNDSARWIRNKMWNSQSMWVAMMKDDVTSTKCQLSKTHQTRSTFLMWQNLSIKIHNSHQSIPHISCWIEFSQSHWQKQKKLRQSTAQDDCWNTSDVVRTRIA